MDKKLYEKLVDYIVPSEQYDTKLEIVLNTLNTLSSCQANKVPPITKEVQNKLEAVIEKSGDKEELRVCMMRFLLSLCFIEKHVFFNFQEIVQYSKQLLGKITDTEEIVDK